MKLNGTPRHYMPLSQSQSDDEESVPKPPKFDKVTSENLDLNKSFDQPVHLSKHAYNTDPKCTPMSPLRTIAFVLSLMMCVCFISVFLLLIPCEVVSQESLFKKWTINLENKSLTSGVSLVRISPFSSPVLLFGYKQWLNNTSNDYGVIALWKNDGEIKWKSSLYFEVTSILCNAVDINNDGIFDCFLMGEQGLMNAIDPKTGKTYWYIHTHGTESVADCVSSATVISDCDGDSIPDLVVSYKFYTDLKGTYMGLISGGTGQVIGSPVSIHHCTLPVVAHMSMNLKNRTALMFYCADGKAGNLFISYSEEFCHVALNRSLKLKTTALHRSIPMSSEVQLYKISDQEAAVILNGSKVLFIKLSPRETFKVIWIEDLKKGLFWRIVTHGHFLHGGESELVLISSNGYESKVIGLNLSNGKKVWSVLPFHNASVISALYLPSFFRDVDGIVLKLLIPRHSPRLKVLSDSNNATNDNITLVKARNDKKGEHLADEDEELRVLEERYVLMRSGKTAHFDKICSQQIWYSCKDFQYQPDIFNKRNTAVATLLNNEESDMTVLSTSMVPYNHPETLQFETVIKQLKLEKFLQFSKCMYKLSC